MNPLSRNPGSAPVLTSTNTISHIYSFFLNNHKVFFYRPTVTQLMIADCPATAFSIRSWKEPYIKNKAHQLTLATIKFSYWPTVTQSMIRRLSSDSTKLVAGLQTHYKIQKTVNRSKEYVTLLVIIFFQPAHITDSRLSTVPWNVNLILEQQRLNKKHQPIRNLGMVESFTLPEGH